MAQAAEKIIEFPAGGIADFYMEDDEIEALGQLEAEEQFGNKGIANFSVVAERMASYGRHGDDTVAHVETGELVIPKALIEDNPKLRDSIFEHLEELGVEDPERYVVGSGVNSINPDTGLPEFFFKKIARAVKKTVKKVSRAVKKVAKSVVKVVKKAAPIVLPIALSFTPLGAIYGAALGSGIGTLIQGGSIKDAFKSALIAGATGAVFKGLGNKLSGQGTFMEGVKKAAANPMGRLTQTASGLGSTLTGGGFTGQGNLFSDFVPTPSVESAVADTTNLASDQLAADTAVGQDAGLDAATRNELYEVSARPAATVDPNAVASDASSFTDFMEPPAGSNLSTDVVTGGDRSFLQKTGDYMFRGGQSPEAIAGAQAAAEQKAIQNTLLKYGHQGPLTTASPTIASKAIAAGEAAAAGAGPGMLATYGPSAALGIGATAALGGFTPPEEPPQEELQTGADLIALNPDEYLLPEETPQYAQGPIQVGTDYGIDPRTGRPIVNPFRRPVYGRPVYAAEGGEIFPRRVGGIMPNEGTPGKDSVRAMLMPGEFVMTTDAVKGLGGGNNDRGINRMYDMMRGLEAKGRAMA
jgi:hypothetical protein